MILGGLTSGLVLWLLVSVMFVVVSVFILVLIVFGGMMCFGMFFFVIFVGFVGVVEMSCFLCLFYLFLYTPTYVNNSFVLSELLNYISWRIVF